MPTVTAEKIVTARTRKKDLHPTLTCRSTDSIRHERCWVGRRLIEHPDQAVHVLNRGGLLGNGVQGDTQALRRQLGVGEIVHEPIVAGVRRRRCLDGKAGVARPLAQRLDREGRQRRRVDAPGKKAPNGYIRYQLPAHRLLQVGAAGFDRVDRAEVVRSLFIGTGSEPADNGRGAVFPFHDFARLQLTHPQRRRQVSGRIEQSQVRCDGDGVRGPIDSGHGSECLNFGSEGVAGRGASPIERLHASGVPD